MKKLSLLLIALFSFSASRAQMEANIWYFGANAGVTFASGAPVALTNGNMNSFEGSATICDAAGNLLFYTDGMTVWNKTMAVMTNGTGLMGNSSSTQSGVIIKKPGSNTIYYLFTTDAQAGANGLRWSEIDLAQSGGNGAVTANKNILLWASTTERIAGVRHCNNIDVWVVTHDWNSNNFRTYPVTSAGIGAAINTAIGSVHNGTTGNTIGYLKASPDGKKLACAIRYLSAFELFDFNNSTGVISNFVSLGTTFPYTYGVEFSPDGTRLYGNSSQPGRIWQWNLCAGSNAAIVASATQIGSSAQGWLGALQMGRDKKIYMCRYTDPWLAVIPNPNTLGTGCGYTDNGVSLLGRASNFGLPNYVANYFKTVPPFTTVINCLNVTFTPPTVNNTNCSGSTNAVVSQSWNFGDPNSGGSNTSTSSTSSHTFTSSGTFNVVLVLNYACGFDSIKQTVTVTSCGITVTAPGGTVCPGGCKNITATVSAGTSPYTYSWSTGATTQSINPCPTITTSYTVLATDANGATASTVATITVSSAIVINTTVQNVKCNGGTTGSATSTVSGGTSPYTYSWSNAQTGSSTSGLGQGNYTLTVTDANGCTGTATVVITQPSQLAVAVAGGSISCNGGNNGSLSATASGGTSNYTYSWSNAQTGATATGLIAGTYTVTVTDANGCTATATATATQPTAIAIQTSTTNATCAQAGTISTTVTGGTGSYTYTWSNGQTGATATGLSAGTYIVGVADANGCTKTATATITGIAGPTAAGMSTVNNVLCNGGTTGSATATATGGTGSYTYSWSNTLTNATATGLAAGTYTVTITDANNCSITAAVTITEPTALVVTANGSSACLNATATGSASGGTGTYNYLWSNGQNTQNATGLNAGVYTLTVTDANGCTSQDTALVSISPPPLVAFAADDSAGCVALCVNFTCNSSNITSYTWNFGDGSNGNGSTVNHCYKNTGSFTVTLTVTDNNGCTGSLTKNSYISVYPNVVASFTSAPQPTTILNPTITFTDMSQGGANTWSWTFLDDGSTSTLQNPRHTYKDSGCYNVQLIADNQYNCPDTTSEVICINGDFELFAPNAFTPDGTGLNDNWNVKGIGIDPNHFELYIYDRWGNLIFKTTDLYEGWNGHANGGKDIAQQDVYVWKAFVRDYQGGKHNYIGHVTLVR